MQLSDLISRFIYFIYNQYYFLPTYVYFVLIWYHLRSDENIVLWIILLNIDFVSYFYIKIIKVVDVNRSLIGVDSHVRLVGLVAWFSLWVREVPGSIPGQALFHVLWITIILKIVTWIMESV